VRFPATARIAQYDLFHEASQTLAPACPGSVAPDGLLEHACHEVLVTGRLLWLTLASIEVLYVTMSTESDSNGMPFERSCASNLPAIWSSRLRRLASSSGDTARCSSGDFFIRMFKDQSTFNTSGCVAVRVPQPRLRINILQLARPLLALP
jgi:hypothetical protein